MEEPVSQVGKSALAFFGEGMVLKKVLRMLKAPAPHAKKKRGAWARWIGRTLAHLHYAVAVEPTWLEVNRLDIPIQDLPASFAGLRVVHMTDFHGSSHVTSAYLEEAVALRSEERRVGKECRSRRTWEE